MEQGMNQTQILRSLMESMQEASRPKTSAYDTTATVRRIEDGVAWVHIPGGVDETPVKLTINAKEGDTVQVRVSGGTAFLVGNGTAPPTDDATAIVAQKTADGAVEKASNASEEAARAKESADIAASAADSAQRSADNAGEYAARALGNLSTVQSVAETLTWITQHGTMTLTTDTELDPSHVYFVRDTGGDYVVGNVHYSVVKEPSADDLASYYVLSIDESLQNYVGTHLALTGEGLWILPENNGYKVLIATGSGEQYKTAGTYIVDAGGAPVAVFGSDGTRIMTDGVQVFNVNATDVSDYVQAKEDILGSYREVTDRSVSVQSSVQLTNITQGSIIDVNIYFKVGGRNGEVRWYSTYVQQGGSKTENYGPLVVTVRHNATSSPQTISVSVYTTDSHTSDYYYFSVRYVSYSAYVKTPSFSLGTRVYSSGGNGAFSTIVGEGLMSGTRDQLVTGKYNAEDADDQYALIIGNGSDESSRSNALTVDWNGTIKSADGFSSSADMIRVTDCNNATDPRKIYYTNGDASNLNRPEAGWCVIRSLYLNGNPLSGNTWSCMQLGMPMNTGVPRLFVRSKIVDAGWSSWKTLTIS
jgi:hypothetical protein